MCLDAPFDAKGGPKARRRLKSAPLEGPTETTESAGCLFDCMRVRQS